MPHRDAAAALDALTAVASASVVALDFDGVLSPIVADPTTAHIHPEAPEVLLELAEVVQVVAVVTGRPTAQALELGRLAEVGAGFAERGAELLVLGQYGNERWSSAHPAISSPPPPEGLAAFEEALPGLLHRAGAGQAWVEHKGLAVAVHTRRMDRPDEAFGRLLQPLGDLAASHGLVLEPGRQVIEVRGPGRDKGDAVTALAAEHSAAGFLFAGDDLGDVPAFEAVARLGEQGLATVLVCSASEEQVALRELADLVVPGPDGVLDLLRTLVSAARG